MEDHIRRVFYAEVERQSAFALIAIGDLTSALFAQNTSLARRDPSIAVGATDRIWYSVQALLIAAGNVSKLLWPTKEYAARGAALRHDLEVADDSVLGPRTFRNHFEHFDERLEQWAASPNSNTFVDSNIGPPGMIGGLDETKFMRNLDTKNVAVTFQGKSYPLRPIAAAFVQLQDRAKVLAEVPAWRASARAAS